MDDQQSQEKNQTSGSYSMSEPAGRAEGFMPKNSNKKVVIVVIIVFVFLVLGAGVYWWKASHFQPLTGRDVFINEGPAVPWQTYRNDEYWFEIEYPKDWITETDSTEKTFELKIKKPGDNDYAQKTNIAGGVLYPLYFKITVRPTDEVDVGKMIDSESKEAETGIGAYAQVVSQTTVDGVKALWLENCVEMSSEQGPVAIKNGYRYFLGLPLECIARKGPNEPKDPELLLFYQNTDSQYGPIFRQIFSTFKFIK